MSAGWAVTISVLGIFVSHSALSGWVLTDIVWADVSNSYGTWSTILKALGSFKWRLRLIAIWDSRDNRGILARRLSEI
jgi:hypothetical protein